MSALPVSQARALGSVMVPPVVAAAKEVAAAALPPFALPPFRRRAVPRQAAGAGPELVQQALRPFWPRPVHWAQITEAQADLGRYKVSEGDG